MLDGWAYMCAEPTARALRVPVVSRPGVYDAKRKLKNSGGGRRVAERRHRVAFGAARTPRVDSKSNSNITSGQRWQPAEAERRTRVVVASRPAPQDRCNGGDRGGRMGDLWVMLRARAACDDGCARERRPIVTSHAPSLRVERCDGALERAEISRGDSAASATTSSAREARSLVVCVQANPLPRHAGRVQRSKLEPWRATRGHAWRSVHFQFAMQFKIVDQFAMNPDPA